MILGTPEAQVYHDQARMVTEAILAASRTLSLPEPKPGDPAIEQAMQNASRDVLARYAEYVNIGVVPIDPPTFPPATFPSIGTLQEARFDKAFAAPMFKSLNAPWEAYLWSIYGDNYKTDAQSPHVRAAVLEQGVAAVHALYQRQYDTDMATFESHERELYQITLSSGVALWVSTVFQYIRKADIGPIIDEFRSDANVPMIVECSGTALNVMADAIRGLSGKNTKPIERQIFITSTVRSQVAAIQATLDAARRGSFI